MDQLSMVMKYVAGGALYGLWASLVFTGRADAGPLIAAIGAGISALLGYHAITNLQGVKQDSVAQIAGAIQQLQTPQVPVLKQPQ